MSEQISIINDEVVEIIIEQDDETVIISEVGLPGPQGPPGDSGDEELTEQLWRSTPGNILYRMYINDDGSPQWELA